MLPSSVFTPLVCPVVLQGSSIARDMRTSIHRCLVFLGDLSRYASQAAPKAAAVVAAPAAGGSSGSSGAAAANTAAKAEWSKAVGYYRMAAHVLPRRWVGLGAQRLLEPSGAALKIPCFASVACAAAKL
jgi:hypothetical protein